MSEVRMSLSEYNEMKEMLDRHSRILHAILTPAHVSEFDINWHREHPAHNIYVTSDTMDNLSYEDKEYLKSIVYSNASVLAEEQFVRNDMALMFEMSLGFQLGYFKDIEEPQMEKEEE